MSLEELMDQIPPGPMTRAWQTSWTRELIRIALAATETRLALADMVLIPPRILACAEVLMAPIRPALMTAVLLTRLIPESTVIDMAATETRLALADMVIAQA